MAATNPTAHVISAVLCSLFVCMFLYSAVFTRHSERVVFVSADFSVSAEEKIVVVVHVILILSVSRIIFHLYRPVFLTDTLLLPLCVK